jgi:exodeoxyribonuclease V gamma subunit
MLRLIQSNDLEQLGAQFCIQSAARQGDPLQPEIVLVQSLGTGQWLKLQTAERLGIAANITCQLPAQFIWQLYQQVLGLEQQQPVEAGGLAFRLMHLLENFEEPSIRAYLERGSEADLRYFQLAAKISAAFENYLLYRPDWLLAWQSGQTGVSQNAHSWQPKLWQHLVTADPNLAKNHRAYLHQKLIEALQAPKLNTALPKRISLFGLASLAPMHLETFSQLANHCQVDLYFMNPSEAYWGDIVSAKRAQKQKLKTAIASQDKDSGLAEDYYFLGNPLLSSLGRQGQEFHELLTAEPNLISEEYFIPPGRDSRLHVIQDDLFHAREAETSDTLHLPDWECDQSLIFHSCHSRLREMEVLLDSIYRALTESSLTPSDIIVMAPNIQEYLPVIHAVFGDEMSYGIADQNHYQSSDIFRTFIDLLKLPESRLTASEMLQWLEVPAIARKFEIDAEGLKRVKTWIQETGIRWAWDAERKARRWEVPAEHQFTWRFGIDRLLMGVMTDDSALCQNIAPYPVESENLDILEGFLRFANRIAATQAALTSTRTPGEFNALLIDIIGTFFEPIEHERIDIARLQDLAEEFLNLAEAAKLTRPLSTNFVQYWLEQALLKPQPSMRFITGGVTFSTLTPMRSIPFKMVCLVGMNESEFPRQQTENPFDLMAQIGPMLGDRSRQEDDRYLFLEALLSARERLHVSFCGRSPRDNERLPPSVVLSEFIDYCDTIFNGVHFVDHPLQPFSHRYFKDQLIHSFEHHWLEGLTAAQSDPHPLTTLRIDSPKPMRLEISELAQFFKHTARYFFEYCFNIDLRVTTDISLDQEPFTLDALSRFQLIDLAVDTLARGGSSDQWVNTMISSGAAINHRIGQERLENVARQAQNLLAAIGPHLVPNQKPTHLKLTANGIELECSLTNLTEDSHLAFRAGDLSHKHLFESWLEHLMLAATHHSTTTHAFGLKQGKTLAGQFAPIEPRAAKEWLDDYVHLYLEGRSRPLLFPFGLASDLVKRQSKGEDPTFISAALDHQWTDSHFAGEGQDPYWSRLIQKPSDIIEPLADFADRLLLDLDRHWVKP